MADMSKHIWTQMVWLLHLPLPQNLEKNNTHIHRTRTDQGNAPRRLWIWTERENMLNWVHKRASSHNGLFDLVASVMLIFFSMPAIKLAYGVSASSAEFLLILKYGGLQ